MSTSEMADNHSYRFQMAVLFIFAAMMIGIIWKPESLKEVVVATIYASGIGTLSGLLTGHGIAMAQMRKVLVNSDPGSMLAQAASVVLQPPAPAAPTVAAATQTEEAQPAPKEAVQ